MASTVRSCVLNTSCLPASVHVHLLRALLPCSLTCCTLNTTLQPACDSMCSSASSLQLPGQPAKLNCSSFNLAKGLPHIKWLHIHTAHSAAAGQLHLAEHLAEALLDLVHEEVSHGAALVVGVVVRRGGVDQLGGRRHLLHLHTRLQAARKPA
eukprot:GHRQ01024847.1.p1 GENE.GHRQ01024847.1~~GHRQ01024847.1.p1  ORF type:complete len:153 (+),score=21.83 GHRQ01024847.1:535-993(+)